MLNTPRLRRLASVFGWAPEPTRDAGPARRTDVSHRSEAPAPPRQRVVALLVPESGDSTFRLRAAPDALPDDDVPDGAGSIYRTRDGRIALDWHRAS